MADSQDNPPNGEGNHIRIEGRRLVFEVRIVLESVSHGLEALISRPEALFLKEELGVLRKLTTQAAEALEAFSELISANPTS